MINPSKRKISSAVKNCLHCSAPIIEASVISYCEIAPLHTLTYTLCVSCFHHQAESKLIQQRHENAIEKIVLELALISANEESSNV